MIEFVQIVSICGAVLSMLTAYLSYKSIGKRLDVEKELNYKIHLYFVEHESFLKDLEEANDKGEMKNEIYSHLFKYEKFLNEIVTEMPDEKRERVYPAINQRSEKGKVAYISKLISRSLAKV